ncbi:uncharacterized protein E0L32_000242 [Thyridium curvatum]|uniref:cutinase n=1 Tax=Thyridium curvatum TaxID=1093900 RepID=A0A507BGR3_9PEZI|nr:uncharacterized protein E0L32_000242 [Thyridium curvatum]TPX15908.1 hypothetical protein E0L32_000242 [Thyridium curvatum]
MKLFVLFSTILVAVVLSQTTYLNDPLVTVRADGVPEKPVTVEHSRLLSFLLQLFPARFALKEARDLMHTAERAIALTFGLQSVENQLPKAGEPCPSVTIIYARGTYEIGNVGVLVGPGFFEAVKLATSATNSSVSVAVQGVEYAAIFPEYVKGGDRAGSQKMYSYPPSQSIQVPGARSATDFLPITRADDVSQALEVCPQTKVVMAGFSQGGQVVHNAAAQLPPATMAQVSSVVIFGDPLNGTAVAGAVPERVLVLCHESDIICQGSLFVPLSHMTYLADVGEAAEFVAKHL